jgi:AraC family transcriptional regulator, transcriptional activator of pobA
MNNLQPYRIKTISEFHRFRKLPRPEHPLISIVDYGSMSHDSDDQEKSLVLDFYSIALKRFDGEIKYGQQEYDFDEGTMFFMAPGQVFRIGVESSSAVKQSGWLLFIHPDFFWNTSLAKSIKRYEYFNYSAHEALFLSAKEEATVTGVITNIEQEYHANIDHFSQGIIVTQLESLLSYAERFYHRQFITRKISNHQVLTRLEELLAAYFDGDEILHNGLPTVSYVSGKLNISSDYLSGSLKVLTGLNTQQHIHRKLIEKAKEKLSTTNLSVSEIAYQLGFEHLQSFSKLFRAKTSLSPLEFRQSFN